MSARKVTVVRKLKSRRNFFCIREIRNWATHGCFSRGKSHSDRECTTAGKALGMTCSSAVRWLVVSNLAVEESMTSKRQDHDDMEGSAMNELHGLTFF